MEAIQYLESFVTEKAARELAATAALMEGCLGGRVIYQPGPAARGWWRAQMFFDAGIREPVAGAPDMQDGCRLVTIPDGEAAGLGILIRPTEGNGTL